MNLQVIKGKDLTSEQRAMLKFNGMKNESWVNNHSFNFIDGVPAKEGSGLYYPICNSLSHLPS